MNCAGPSDGRPESWRNGGGADASAANQLARAECRLPSVGRAGWQGWWADRPPYLKHTMNSPMLFGGGTAQRGMLILKFGWDNMAKHFLKAGFSHGTQHERTSVGIWSSILLLQADQAPLGLMEAPQHILAVLSSFFPALMECTRGPRND